MFSPASYFQTFAITGGKCEEPTGSVMGRFFKKDYYGFVGKI
jgi:hypothetical protein